MTTPLISGIRARGISLAWFVLFSWLLAVLTVRAAYYANNWVTNTSNVSITGLTEQAAPVAGTTYVVIYDTTANALRKVALANLPTGGGGEANTGSNLGGGYPTFAVKSGIDLRFNTFTNSPATLTVTSNANLFTWAVTANGIAGAQVSVDATLEGEIEAVVDLQDLQGAATDAQIPNTITVDLSTLASTVTIADGADSTSFPTFVGTITGNLAILTDPTYIFDPTTGTLGATTFSGAGGGLTLDASGFNGNLAVTDNTLQEVAQKLDDLTAGTGDITGVGDVASGEAFNGTQGTTLTFNDTEGDHTLLFNTTLDQFEFSTNVVGAKFSSTNGFVSLGTAGTATMTAVGTSFSTTLSFTDPTADRAVVFPDRAGTVSLSGDTLTGDVTATLETDGTTATTIAANSVALTTDTTGNYAAGDAEAGAALTGDSATAFFGSGTLEDARLSANVALLNATQTFTAPNTFSGSTNFTASVTNATTTQSAVLTLNAGAGPVATLSAYSTNSALPAIRFNGVHTNTTTSVAFLEITPQIRSDDFGGYNVLKIMPTEVGTGLGRNLIVAGVSNSISFLLTHGGLSIGNQTNTETAGLLTLLSPLTNANTITARFDGHARDDTSVALQLGSIGWTMITNTHDLVYPSVDFNLRRTTTSPVLYYRFAPDLLSAPAGFFTNTVTATTFSGAGGGLTLDASGFNLNLTTSDNTLQEVAQKFDDFVASGSNAQYVNDTNTTPINIQDTATITWTRTAGTNALGSVITVPVVDTTDASAFFTFVDTATGNQAVKTDAGATYDASTGTAGFTIVGTPQINLNGPAGSSGRIHFMENNIQRGLLMTGVNGTAGDFGYGRYDAAGGFLDIPLLILGANGSIQMTTNLNVAGALVVTNGITNITLTASQSVVTDANKKLSSVAYTGAGNVMRTRTGVWQSQWIDAGAWKPSQTNPAVAATIIAPAGADYVTEDCYAFNDTTEQSVEFKFKFPRTWDAGTIKYRVDWKATSTSGTNVWALKAKSVADGESTAGSWGSEITVLDQPDATANELNTTAASSALTVGGTPAVGETTYFKFSRKPLDGSDNLSGDGKPTGLWIDWLQSTTEPAAP